MKNYNDLFIGWSFKEEKYHVFDDDFNYRYSMELKDLKPSLYKMDFGKHTGKTLDLVLEEDPQYIDWLKENQSPNSLLVHCLNNL